MGSVMGNKTSNKQWVVLEVVQTNEVKDFAVSITENTLIKWSSRFNVHTFAKNAVENFKLLYEGQTNKWKKW